MILVCNGRAYSTAEMRVFRTGDPAIPYIYLTPDGRSTFVLERDSDGTLEAHRAGTGEIIRLSRLYRLDGLLGAFPAVFAPVEILARGVCEDEDVFSGAVIAGGADLPSGVQG